jgi:glycine/D-amino acid oxidase-like deaminating enzyme
VRIAVPLSVVADVAVVGAGIMGSATAYALARDGHGVTLYEQFEVGHTRGSSHGRSRIVRLAYPEVEFVELAKESFAGWRELEREAGVQLLELNGLLELVDDPAAGLERGARGSGRGLRARSHRKRQGTLAVGVPDGWSALFQPEAGIVRADRACAPSSNEPSRTAPISREHARVESLDDVDAEVSS